MIRKRLVLLTGGLDVIVPCAWFVAVMMDSTSTLATPAMAFPSASRLSMFATMVNSSIIILNKGICNEVYALSFRAKKKRGS